jgi:aryl-alcohol dehydrogenase-like predicted oxidoreductase
MNYRQLGSCGLRVSDLCLGTMTFGHGTDEQEAGRMVARALDAGINFIDTANSYAEGQSETILGKALHGRRDDVVLATKFYNPMGSGPNDSGMSRYHVMNAIDASLRRLATDHVDIYYIHHVDNATPIEEMLRALDDLVRAGKVRYVACSNYEAWRLVESLWISETNGLARFVCHQPQYNLVVRDIEVDVLPVCERKGLGVVTWGPLAGGFLSGAYKPGERTKKGTRSEEGFAFPGRFFAPNADETLATLLDVAADLDRAPAEVAIRWLLEQTPVSSVIVGARTLAHLETNLNAAEWRMPPEALKRLTDVSAPRIKYPEAMEWTRDASRLAAIAAPGASARSDAAR